MAIDPMTALALAQGGLGAIQKGMAAGERKRADSEFKRFEIPSSIKAMMGVMESLSTQTELPGSDILRSRQEATTAQGVETAQRTSESGGDALGLLSEMYGKQLDSAERMAVQGAEYYQTNRARYANALQTMGQYQQEQWKYNELYPYMQKMTAAGESDAAGGANVSGGMGSMIDIFGANKNMDFQERMFNEWQNNKFGQNLGEPYDRTRFEDSTLRNLKQPELGLKNPERTQLSPWIP